MYFTYHSQSLGSVSTASVTSKETAVVLQLKFLCHYILAEVKKVEFLETLILFFKDQSQMLSTVCELLQYLC